MKHLTAIAVLLVAVTATCLLWPAGNPVEPPTTSNISVPITDPNPGPNVSTANIPAQHPAADNGASTPNSAPEVEPATEVLFGVEVLRDRNCDVRERYLQAEDGSVLRALNCELRSAGRGQLDHYSDETLSVMAETDAEAARELGRRLLTREPRAGTRYLLRSIALDTASTQDSTRLSPLWEIVQERFRTDAVMRGNPAALKNMHLFYSLGLQLDSDYAFYADESRQLLIDAGMSESEVSAIEQRSALFLDNMSELRQAIIGEPMAVEHRL